MSTVAPTAGLPLWRAPLAPIALAWTAGIVLDRYAVVPLPISLIAALGATLAWLLHVPSQKSLGVVYLWLGVAALGAAWHHTHRQRDDPDDISHTTDHDGRPLSLRGAVLSAPSVSPAPKPDPLRSQPAKATLASRCAWKRSPRRRRGIGGAPVAACR
jgi:hypothetical protein